MAEGRGVAILVGAGDAIGAAVARRFAKGGYTVCAHWAIHEQRREAYQKAVAANVPLTSITPAPAKV